MVSLHYHLLLFTFGHSFDLHLFQDQLPTLSLFLLHKGNPAKRALTNLPQLLVLLHYRISEVKSTNMFVPANNSISRAPIGLFPPAAGCDAFPPQASIKLCNRQGRFLKSQKGPSKVKKAPQKPKRASKAKRAPPKVKNLDSVAVCMTNSFMVLRILNKSSFYVYI